MTVAYATREQLVDYLPSHISEPDDADRLLQRASERVDEFILSPFDIDSETSLPTDETIAEALVNAVCAQVEFWAEVGEEHDVDGIRGDMSLNGVSYSSPPTLAPRARSFLTQGGLMCTAAVIR